MAFDKAEALREDRQAAFPGRLRAPAKRKRVSLIGVLLISGGLVGLLARPAHVGGWWFACAGILALLAGYGALWSP